MLILPAIQLFLSTLLLPCNAIQVIRVSNYSLQIHLTSCVLDSHHMFGYNNTNQAIVGLNVNIFRLLMIFSFLSLSLSEAVSWHWLVGRRGKVTKGPNDCRDWLGGGKRQSDRGPDRPVHSFLELETRRVSCEAREILNFVPWADCSGGKEDWLIVIFITRKGSQQIVLLSPNQPVS